MLAQLYGKFAISSHTKENWQREVLAELFDRTTALEGEDGWFSREFWSAVSSRLDLTSVAPEIRQRWKRKFLLLPFLGEIKTGTHKRDLWILVYGGTGAVSDTGVEARQLLRRTYGSVFDALSHHFEKLEEYADFNRQDLDIARNRDEAQLELWLLP